MTDKPAAWWAISEDAFLDALFYANSEHEHVEEDR